MNRSPVDKAGSAACPDVSGLAHRNNYLNIQAQKYAHYDAQYADSDSTRA
jgi:hypothetical protein